MSSTEPSNDLVRIGILGCASISKKNAIAILDKSPGCLLTAIASRSLEKAQAFRNDFFMPRQLLSQEQTTSSSTIECFGGSSAYDDLLKSPCVDAVYIPVPTCLHKEWSIKALTAGKHVMLEKPVALSDDEYQEILAVAKKRSKYLQDGTMFHHHPRTKDFVRAVQDTSTIGTVKRIEAGFSFCGDDAFFEQNIRIKKDGDPLGCIGDLAWYVIRIALLVVAGEESNSTTCSNSGTPGGASAQVVDYQLNDEGVPIDATCLVKFLNHDNNKNIVLSFHCGFCTQFRQYVHVVGTKSWASMNDFVLPKEHPVKYQVESMSLTNYDLITEHLCLVKEFGGPVQEVLMWKTFARLTKAIDSFGWEGDSDDCREALQLSHVSSANQRVLDALMTSIQNGGRKVDVKFHE